MTPAASFLEPLNRSTRRWWSGLFAAASEAADEEQPLRAALLSADQMALHGKRLAAAHVLATGSGPDRLLARLASNEAVLVDVCDRLGDTLAAKRRITPAAEWLLDNFYLIEEEIRTARRHLPRGYSRELPRLDAVTANGASAGLPRVYDLALQTISHGDGRVSRGTLSRFVAAYQSVQPLLIGELWAIPIMLRLALIENLRREAARVAAAREARELADDWADQMLDIVEQAPTDLILVLADMARSKPALTPPFVSELARRLQGRSAALALPLTWMEQRLAESSQTIEQLVHAEGQIQAATQVSVSNSIGSLRLLGATDWREFVETLSGVEQTLRTDPAGVYAQMDFGTRDRYRHAVERIARRCIVSESEVARQAVRLAHDGADAVGADAVAEPDARRAHVGCYLIGDGVAALEQAAGARLPAPLALARRARRRPLPLYVGAVALGTVALSAGPLLEIDEQMLPWWLLLPIAAVLLLAASQFAVALANWLATLLLTPHPLPRLDYSFGIAPDARSLVVVPTLLGSMQGIDELVEALEVRFLANRDPRLHFALLTDFHDAVAEQMPHDDALLAAAAAKIAALNAKHRPPDGGNDDDIFFLLHRPRRWNAREGVWMGYERKRGKLADLNALLRGKAAVGPGERFSRIVGDTRVLTNVRYVITLDTDTQLPRDAAAQFVATMAHPLNRPRFGGGERSAIVTAGYGILQPRVGASLPSTNRTGYARLYGGEAGIDPYTRAVSDVYQDLFGEGSFIGKGIYDVDAFERALGDRLPENRILSHDLLEGCYARSGLLSDVQLIEPSPARYGADVARRHRWIRGDWQLLGWLRSRLHHLPGAGQDERERAPPNPLSSLSRWKMLDNLRRSLWPSALLAMLLLGWSVLPDPAAWTLRALAIVGLVPLAAYVLDLLLGPEERLRGPNKPGAGLPFGRQAQQVAMTLACLPYEAAYSLDAIGRSLWRTLFSRRRMLEWRPSNDFAQPAEPGGLADLLGTARKMWIGPVLAVAAAAVLALLRPPALGGAAPLLLLWFASPLLVWWFDRPLRPAQGELGAAQTVFLRRLARRTWAFFENHVGPDDHHLPPDNVQEQPVARIAHRTSPTNMGFALLANLAARDFGYLSAGQMLARTDAALTTMQGLARHRGHFYNWYDTRSLEPLRPHYISAVDSGNLAGYLLTLRAGLLALADEPLLAPGWCEGLRDTLGLLHEALGEGGNARAPLQPFEQLLERHRSRPPATLEAASAMHAALGREARTLHDALLARQASEPQASEVMRWAEALVDQCAAAEAELALLAPWAAEPREGAAASAMPSLRDLASSAPGSDGAAARERIALADQLAARAGTLAEMDTSFLYDRSRHLTHIGYNAEERRLDAGYYDLLASEARLGSFVAIALGQAPQDSWFALGRLLTAVDGEAMLLSWSGSMFEYLMPMLVMPSYANTLLDQTCQAAVQRQIDYGRQRGVPWGISESGYNATDTALNYQYRAFGVPGLGLKRGLARDLVIAPYASVLALMVAPLAACANLQRLADEGAGGVFGLHEAIDYTPSRLPRGQSSALVRSYMAHHQGMSLLALAHLLLGRPMQRRFEADARLQATLLLLQERIPNVVAIHPHVAERAEMRSAADAPGTAMRVFDTPDTPTPEVQLLSNGRYHVMLTNAGGGYSRWKDLAVTRWREDGTCDAWGSFSYIRDLATGVFWSGAHQPVQRRGQSYEAIFSEGRAEFRRSDQGIDVHTEIVVSPEDDIELRRLRITNASRARRTLEITSYAEVVLAPAVADALHPAFGKLFVQTEVVRQPAALLCTRRPRSPEEPAPWLFQLMAVHGVRSDALSHETDRARFIGRGRSLRAPQALQTQGPLSNTAGAVLDPIVASRCVITLEADQTAVIDIACGMAETRAGALALVEKYHDRRLADRVFELAWTHAQVVLRQLDASEVDAQLYGRLAGAVIHSQPALRAESAVLLRNRRPQSGLWAYAISGDLPIVLLRIGEAGSTALLRQLVQAHAWWRLKGLAVDLVIWNEERDVYRQQLQEQIMGLVSAGVEAHVMDRPGGIFVRQAEQISPEDRVLLQSVARVVIHDGRGSLGEQLSRQLAAERRATPLVPVLEYRAPAEQRSAVRTPEHERRAPARATAGLLFFNGLGGFAPDGREYVIAPPAGAQPPAPWVNVIANPRFGTLVSEAGSAYTWCENAHELRLTPWHNDPVLDASGEAIYLRDEETGHYWSPTALPSPGRAPYITRHGFGSSVFEHDEDGIHSRLQVFVALDAAVKFSVLRLRNDSAAPRRLSATGYVEWVLGDLRARTAPHIGTEVAPDSGALYARNPYSNDFGDWVGFFDVDAAHRVFSTVTCDRAEFIGRNRSLRNPAALGRTRLSGRTGAALDPCAAIHVPLQLAPGQTGEIVFRLGMGRSTDEAEQLIERFRPAAAAAEALEAVQHYWQQTLGAVQVKTPDPALDLLANGWLVYQTLACRLWGRSGFYQSGGAFGFRDQLQDAMALVHTQPQLLREQLLLCASRQFVEGDVQHWWHPPAGRGVRTHISDDYLWLPLALARYVEATADTGVLTETVHFLDGRAVNPHDDSYYDLPGRSAQSASLYQHAVRALAHGFRYGAHGLPLMGGGDWNDGMNLVGHRGQGESVWLGFFLCEVLRRFVPLARRHGDAVFAERCEAERATLSAQLEGESWDGQWYRRAYFDDGTPLGSAGNAECRIDSIAQSWSVLSGVGEPERAQMAMDALQARLVRPADRVVQLLEPPFDQAGPNPGYISGYVPGVRENGGQYTHGAIWAAMAFAALDQRERAWSLFDLINPVHHTSSAAAVATYKAEPYVMAADVYGVAPHIGRGGWSWYTGSAGWMYRLVIESLLGVSLDAAKDGARLHLHPRLPAGWPGFTLDYRYRTAGYRIEIVRDDRVGGDGFELQVDGAAQAERVVRLLDDGKVHRVELRVGG